MAVERRFPRPQSMTRKQIRSLKVVVRILSINPNGTINRYRILRKSGNRLFDNAAVAAVKKFVPSEGGSGRLPKPTPADLARIHGHPIDLTLRPR
jgi:TonB family protein